MEVIWSDFAIFQLNQINAYLKEKTTKSVADRIINRIIEVSENLASFPAMGQKESEEFVGDANYRYLVEGHYKVVYEIFETDVVIQDVFDSRQNPQKMLKDR